MSGQAAPAASRPDGNGAEQASNGCDGAHGEGSSSSTPGDISGTKHPAFIGQAADAQRSVQDAGSSILGPQRPQPTKAWRRRFLKLLIVGDSGLGKTTLARSLLAVPGDTVQLHDGTATSQEQFKRDPESLCNTVTWQDEDDRIVWDWKVQDTPGFGDDLNIMTHIEMMKDFVEQQNRAWLAIEQDRDRQVDLAEIEDPRVDLCLFCIQPHRLRPVDLRYMSELGTVVPILPVVTKADTMTIREAATYRREVYDKLQNPSIPGSKAVSSVHEPVNVFHFEEATMERAGLLQTQQSQSVPPFLVVASNTLNEEKNSQRVLWPERRYPWGTCEAFKQTHSDLLHLRLLLLKEGCEAVSAAKRTRYLEWRRQHLKRKGRGPVLLKFVSLVILTFGAGYMVRGSGWSPQQAASEARKKLDSRVGAAEEEAAREERPSNTKRFGIF